MNEATPEPDPLDVSVALAAACAIYEAGDARGASAAFAAILVRHPEEPDALRLRGLSLVRAGDAPAALPLLARARQLARDNPLTHLHYGIGLIEAGRPARAAATLRRAINMMPDNPVPWLNFSAALLALGEPRAARAAARRALAIAPRLAASSKPPSSDGLSKKPPRTRSLRERSKKPVGGQPGHPGKTLRVVDNPDHTVDHLPANCANCADPLSQAPGGDYDKRQVFDPTSTPVKKKQRYSRRL